MEIFKLDNNNKNLITKIWCQASAGCFLEHFLDLFLELQFANPRWNGSQTGMKIDLTGSRPVTVTRIPVLLV